MPVVPGTDDALENADQAKAFAAVAGYPVILKARSGGGGRGMRVVRSGACLQSGWWGGGWCGCVGMWYVSGDCGGGGGDSLCTAGADGAARKPVLD